ncbi:MAG: ABC transporter permease [Burkholderiales bacterium]|nr:ABC transporter permease [Burkholderiales bacterium]
MNDQRTGWDWMSVLVMSPLFVFIYLPVGVLVLFSFHAGQVPVPPFEGPSLAWYGKVLESDRITTAGLDSIVVGVVSSLVATLLATLAAWGLARHRVPGARALEALLFLPLAVSYLVIGVGLLVAFSAVGIGKSLIAVGIGHVVLNLPLAFAVVYGQFDRDQARLEQAARDLGASEVQVFLRVTVPLLRPAILAAFLLSLTFSWDEFIVAFLLSGFDPTLPVVIWSMLRTGLNPQTNAAGTLVFLASLAAGIVFELALLRRRRDARTR